MPGIPTSPHPHLCGPVLIVEDDPHLRETLRLALEEEGLPVVTAADGWEALECAARIRPSLVVLDWNLPRLSGESVAAGLRAAFGKTVPIVVITAAGDAAEKAWRVGAYSCVRKPFEIDELVIAVWIGLGSP